jgi:hypothetical protein
MSINNFLKIRIFNLEQNIKSKASDRIKEINKQLAEIASIEEHLRDIEFPNKDIIFINLLTYKEHLTKIRFIEGWIFNYIETYYAIGTVESKPKKTVIKKKKTT